MDLSTEPDFKATLAHLNYYNDDKCKPTHSSAVYMQG